MKKPLHEAARELGCHPFNLVLDLSGMIGSLEDCWPEMDTGLIDSLRVINPVYRTQRGSEELDEQREVEPALPKEKPDELPVSTNAAHIIEKLRGNRKWGKAQVTWRTLQKNYCARSKKSDVEDAVRELHVKGFLLEGSNRGPFSLNQSKTREIEEIVEKLAEKRQKLH